jgi:Protein of unknown function (DUF3006)
MPTEDAPDDLMPHPSFVTVDGLEGHLARVELPDGTTEDWPLASLPPGVREGDVIRLTVHGGDLEAEIDHAQTHDRLTAAQAGTDALNAGAPTGDVDL